MEAAFDLIAYTRKLEDAGFTREQAEMVGNIVSEQNKLRQDFQASAKLQNELATKADILLLKKDIESGILLLKKEIELGDAKNRETLMELQKQMNGIPYKLLIWQFGIGIALATIIAFHA